MRCSVEVYEHGVWLDLSCLINKASQTMRQLYGYETQDLIFGAKEFLQQCHAVKLVSLGWIRNQDWSLCRENP